MAVFSRQIQSAKRMIAKYGQKCKWVERASISEEENPWDQGEADPIIHTDVKIAFFPSALNGMATLARALNKDVIFGNSVAYMAAVNFKPKVTDTIIKADGSPVTIENIQEINPNGESILFIIECNE